MKLGFLKMKDFVKMGGLAVLMASLGNMTGSVWGMEDSTEWELVRTQTLQPQENSAQSRGAHRVSETRTLDQISLQEYFRVLTRQENEEIYNKQTGYFVNLADFASRKLNKPDAQHDIKTGHLSGDLEKMVFCYSDQQIIVEASFHHIRLSDVKELGDDPVGKQLRSKGKTATVITNPRNIPLDSHPKFKPVYFGLFLQEPEAPEGVMIFQSSDEWQNFDRHNTRDINSFKTKFISSINSLLAKN